MRQPRVFITTDTPLKQVTQKMHELYLDAMGIVDKDHKLVGEITTDRLLTLGIPDFFTQLKSVSFINEYDPFEKYFEKEAHQTAADVMSTKYAAVEEDATLLEVVFHLAVQRHAKCHVVRDGVLVGVIDRIVVLDRILNM